MHAIIDVSTADKKLLIRRLARLKSTTFVGDGGEYREDRSYSQVLLFTDKTLGDLESWLYKYSRVDYIGAVDVDKTTNPWK